AKVTPIVYLLVLLARGKWKAAAAGAALAGVFFAFGAAAFGPALSLEWCGVLRAAGSAPATLASPHNMSIAGFVRRALAAQSGIGASETVPAGASTELATILTGVGVALVTGLTALWLVRCRARLGPAECLAGVVPAVLLSAPVTWPHHAVLLLIPLAVAANTALNVPRPRVSDAAWLVAAMLLMTNWPVEQFDLQLPARLSALAGPTTFYAAVLLWSFLLVRSRRAVRVGNSALAADKHSALVPVPTAAARAGAVAEVARP
ncbi:MAG: glycosyltransferase 87 family protein, partial [Planctomycetota bacterium]